MHYNTLQQALSVSMNNMPRKLHGLYAVLRGFFLSLFQLCVMPRAFLQFAWNLSL